MKLDDDININYRIGSPSEEWIKKEADGIHAMGYREGYKQAESDYKKKLDDIKAEIQQVVEEEADDKRWSRGLHYALKIIDKHTGKE